MNQTLFQNSIDKELLSRLRCLFSDLEYMGLIEKYGTYCLFMSSLVKEILQQQGLQTELRQCIACVEAENRRFYLGSKEYTKPNQIAAHIVCIVNQTVLIDFGLGNIRKEYDAQFFKGMILPFDATAELQSFAQIDKAQRIYYREDLAPEDLSEYENAQVQTLQLFLHEYERFRKNRLKFSLSRAFRKLRGASSSMTQQDQLALKQIAGSFDDTWCQ